MAENCLYRWLQIVTDLYKKCTYLVFILEIQKLSMKMEYFLFKKLKILLNRMRKHALFGRKFWLLLKILGHVPRREKIYLWPVFCSVNRSRNRIHVHQAWRAIFYCIHPGYWWPVLELEFRIGAIHHFRINRSLAGCAHSQRRVGVNITIPLHWPSCEWTLTLPIFLVFVRYQQ